MLSLNHTAPLLKRAGLPAAAALALSSAGRADGSRSYLLNGSAGSQKVGEAVAAAVERRNLGWEIKRKPILFVFTDKSGGDSDQDIGPGEGEEPLQAHAELFEETRTSCQY